MHYIFSWKLTMTITQFNELSENFRDLDPDVREYRNIFHSSPMLICTYGCNWHSKSGSYTRTHARTHTRTHTHTQRCKLSERFLVSVSVSDIRTTVHGTMPFWNNTFNYSVTVNPITFSWLSIKANIIIAHISKTQDFILYTQKMAVIHNRDLHRKVTMTDIWEKNGG